MKHGKPFLLLLLLLALAATLAGCGSGIGDVFGGSDDDWSRPQDLRGEVVDVDTAARTLTLDTDASYDDSLRPHRGRQTVSWDERTRVEYDGRTYEPDQLERGDEVRVEFASDESRRGYDLARRIVVLEDVRAGDPVFDDDFPTELVGAVASIDTRDRRIELDRRYDDRYDDRDLQWIHYDERTVVMFEGREYRPENLERGDEIRITGEQRSGRFLADRIIVEQDATPETDSDSSQADLTGTVRSVDARDRFVLLDRSFGADERVYFDDRTAVELDGRRLEPESLRSGDEVTVTGSRRDGRFLADTIRIVREARTTS